MFSTIYGFRPFTLNLQGICRNLSSNTGRSLPTPPNIGILEGPTDWAEARKWATQFKTENIPKTLVELSFSRSSGPGGQLHALVLSAASASIKNETSEETKKRVEGHQKAQKERNRKEKAQRSAVKQHRSGKAKGGWD
ncbi:hypothetical protein HHX47_DHR7000241 [Lentinula edodes]|nr:hypothetical protein HHX47_DHR7000241 [Lentinula edodes]